MFNFFEGVTGAGSDPFSGSQNGVPNAATSSASRSQVFANGGPRADGGSLSPSSERGRAEREHRARAAHHQQQLNARAAAFSQLAGSPTSAAAAAQQFLLQQAHVAQQQRPLAAFSAASPTTSSYSNTTRSNGISPSSYTDFRNMLSPSPGASSSSSSRFDMSTSSMHGGGPPQAGMMLADSMSYHHAQPLGVPPPIRAYDAPVMSPPPPHPQSPPKPSTSLKKIEDLSSHLLQLSSQQALAAAAVRQHQRQQVELKHATQGPGGVMLGAPVGVTHGTVVGLPKHQNFDPATHFGMTGTPVGGAPSGQKRRVKRKKTTIACNHCYKAKAGCDLGRPCIRCIRLGKEGCVDRDPIPKTANTRSRKRRKNQNAANPPSSDSDIKNDSETTVKEEVDPNAAINGPTADSSSTSSISSSSSSRALVVSGKTEPKSGIEALCSISSAANTMFSASVPRDHLSFLASFKMDGTTPESTPEGILKKTNQMLSSLPEQYTHSEHVSMTISAFQAIISTVKLSRRQAQWLSSMAAYATPMDRATQSKLMRTFLEVADVDAEPIEFEQCYTTESEENMKLMPMVFDKLPGFTSQDVLTTVPAAVTRAVVQFSPDGKVCRSVLEFNKRTCELLGMNTEEVQDLLKAGYSRTYHYDDWVQNLRREVANVAQPRTGPTEHESTAICRVFSKGGKAVPCMQVTRARHNEEGLPIAKLIITIPIPS